MVTDIFIDVFNLAAKSLLVLVGCISVADDFAQVFTGRLKLSLLLVVADGTNKGYITRGCIDFFVTILFFFPHVLCHLAKFADKFTLFFHRCVCTLLANKRAILAVLARAFKRLLHMLTICAGLDGGLTRLFLLRLALFSSHIEYSAR